MEEDKKEVEFVGKLKKTNFMLYHTMLSAIIGVFVAIIGMVELPEQFGWSIMWIVGGVIVLLMAIYLALAGLYLAHYKVELTTDEILITSGVFALKTERIKRSSVLEVICSKSCIKINYNNTSVISDEANSIEHHEQQLLGKNYETLEIVYLEGANKLCELLQITNVSKASENKPKTTSKRGRTPKVK